MYYDVFKKKKKEKKKKNNNLNKKDVDSLVPRQQCYQQLGNVILMIFIKQKVILVFAIDQLVAILFLSANSGANFGGKICKAIVVY